MPVRLAIAFSLLLGVLSFPSPAFAQTISCNQFDSWIWAQTIYLEDIGRFGALDPDGNGIACEEIRSVPGFAPATWTDEIPDGLMEAQLVSITDGDTFNVMIDGVQETVRIYRADTPETYTAPQCGGPEATAFTTWALGLTTRDSLVS